MEAIYLIQLRDTTDSVLVDRINTLGNSYNYFGNSWLVKSTLSAKEIYNKISVNYPSAMIFVMKLDVTNYYGFMDKDLWDFIS